MDWVAGQAAQKTAEAGNLMVSGEPADLIESEKVAEEARTFVNCWDVMNLLRNPDFKLQSVVMKPKPLTEPE